MKELRFLISLVMVIGGIIVFNSCDKTENKETGFVTFGANYHIINCPSNVTIYVDNNEIGTLTNAVDTIINCGEESNITKELSTGKHTYKVKIRPDMGSGCTKDINGTFTIDKDECEKILVQDNFRD